MPGETIALTPFQLGATYSRVEIAAAGGVTPPTGPRDPHWSTGIVKFDNAILLLVTLEKDEHGQYAYRDNFDGSLFLWQSQMRQTQDSPVIRNIWERTHTVHLFVRVREKIRNLTQPFVYCGELVVLRMQYERPVTVEFQAMQYAPDTAPEQLLAIYQWRSESPSGEFEQDRRNQIELRRAYGQGRQSDAALRRAIELYGMEKAAQHYRAEGFDVEDTSHNRPYDLYVTRHGEQRRVEVKATQSEGNVVLVTAGEVRAARDPQHVTDLFIVHSIAVNALNPPELIGGEIRLVRGWRPTENELDATAYRCFVAEA